MTDRPESLHDIRATLARLREDYWRGLEEDAAPRAVATLEVLAARLGGQLLGLPGAALREVLRVPPLVRVPGAAPTVAGIISLRGDIVTVSDLRPLLGLAGEPVRGPGARLVVVEVAGQSAALLFDEVLDLRRPTADALETLAAGDDKAQLYFSGRLSQPEGLLTLLDLEKIFSAIG
ncbi:chemotaxis protein CheW [Geoalkalibacter sp.]|uniref:chemotaxis protein CheW n=1 Tax=Geoalkalibacter sp. TaxID=3041440 RepID=UPI00272E1F34|nr:chemotaxis protein CheW [Geoalkalibacter sp.]